MESEKVKEIKKALEYYAKGLCGSTCPRFDKEHINIYCLNELNIDVLTLINELESENKDLQDLCNKTYDDLTKEIDRLEKENAKLLDSVETVQSNRCTTKCKLTKTQLKQFAERLKEKLEEYRLENEYFIKDEPNGNLWQLNASVFCIEVTQDGGLVDETLNKFLKGENNE